ncbi:MAG: hypothetical protein JW976_07140 [Syntrophaceae bacterium]|nr:hypothetical protein [Syntrophaceae bacterium]
MKNNMGFINDLESLIDKSPEHILNWFKEKFASLSQDDFIGSSCPCPRCHHKQFETFSKILSKIEKENLIKVLIKKLNKNSRYKKRTRTELEVVMLLYHWSFLGDTSGRIDFMTGFYYKKIKDDFDSLSLNDRNKIKDKFSDSPPKYFLKIKKMGVSAEILEDYLDYCYKKNFQPFFNQLVQYCLSPKPKIDLNTSFEDRWNKFIEEKKFNFIYLYFNLEKEHEFLKEKIIHYKNLNDILFQIPVGKRFLKWKRFVRNIRNYRQHIIPTDD